MANEGQYINPIIEAMVHTARNAQEARDLAERTRAAKANEAFASHHLDVETERADRDRELRKQEVQNQTDQIHALIDQLYIGNVGKLQEIAQKGGDLQGIYSKLGINQTGGEGPTASYAPQPQIPTSMQSPTATTGLNIPGVGNGINPTAFGSPSQVAQIEYNQAKAKAGGEAEGSEPSFERKAASDFNRMVTLKNIDAEKGKEIEKMRAESAKEVEKMRASAMISAAQIRANLGANIDPDEVANAYSGILNGQTSFSTLPKELKLAVTNLAGQRGSALPTNQKQYSDALNTVGGIEDLIRQYKELAINYSRDSKDASGDHPNVLYRMPFVNGTTIPYTPLKSKSDALKAQGGELASFFDKQNRKSDAEILRQFAGLFDPKSTMKDNLAKIDSHVSSVKKAIKGTFAGINPADVNMILNNRGLTEIGDLNESPAAPSGGSVVDRLVQKHGGR